MVLEIISYIITMALSFASFIIGLTTDLFSFIPNQTLVPFASFALAIIIQLVGERVTAGLRDSLFKKTLIKNIDQNFQRIPQMNIILEFLSSDDAMKHLCLMIPSAHIALNTKISKHSVPPRRDVGYAYEKALTKALKNGIVYKDIISPGFEEYGKGLQKSGLKLPGKYDYRIVDIQANSFLNFIILEYGNGLEELYIGWATSEYMGTEQRAFLIRDNRIISYFKEYHATLWQ